MASGIATDIRTQPDQTLLDYFETAGSTRTRRAAKTKLTLRSLFTGAGRVEQTAGYATVTSIVPDEGDVAGGTAITITGTNLLGVSSVAVGGSPATSLDVASHTTVTCNTPSGQEGAKDVVVTGTRNVVTVTGGFTYTDNG